MSSAAALLLVTGCGGSDPEVLHPVDAAEQMLHALGSEDAGRMCELVADPESGPVPETMVASCQAWAGDLIDHLSDPQLGALRESRVATVTLEGDQRASVQADDYAVAPLSLPNFDLIEFDGEWYVQNLNFQ